VSAETAPHYFTLTDEAVEGYDTNTKMNPPLRSAADREAIRTALGDGTLDVIATDHAPHSILEKEVEFDHAANGIIGLETSLPLGLALVREKVLDPSRLIALMSANPARILGLPGGALTPGMVADITLIDPECTFTYSADQVVSKSRNTPFLGWKLQGRAVMTMVSGDIRYNILK
jgi:dihydroorotase